MKKKAIAILLSIVMAAGSMGAAPVTNPEAEVQDPVETQESEEEYDVDLPVDEEVVLGETEAANAADIDTTEATEITAEIETEEIFRKEEEEETAAEILEDVSEDTSNDPSGEIADEADYYTVTFDANGGTFPDPSGSYKYWKEYTFNGSSGMTYRGPQDTGEIDVPYVVENADTSLNFVGWGYSRNGEIEFVAHFLPGSNLMADIPAKLLKTKNCTLYALWSDEILDSGHYSDSVTYIIDKNGVLTIRGTGQYGYSKASVQSYYRVKKVIIEEGITSIGNDAFGGDASPICTELTYVSFPDSLKAIGNHAFQGCTKLTDVSLPDNLAGIGIKAFSGCTGLTGIRIPGSVKEIEYGAFDSCTNLSDVTICEGVQTIGQLAFRNCSSILAITMPSSLTTIEESAFSRCTGLKKVDFPAGLTTIGDSAFNECSSLEKADLPAGLLNIGEDAFDKCTKLKGVVIPSGVETISSWAFVSCSSLENVTISEGVREIGEQAFGNCKSLTEITIPESVTTIGDIAFNGCNNLKKITIPATVECIGEIAFVACAKDFAIYGYSGSYAETYANENNIPFVDLNSHSITDATVAGISSKTYTGTPQVLSITVKDGSKTLKAGTDYKVSYKNNTGPGKATVTITGIGSYTGTITRTFLILPGKTTRGDMFNLDNNVKIEWKKVPGAKYYKVYRSGIKEPVLVTSALVGYDNAGGLVNGKKYTYKIVASLTGKGDSSGDSPLSYSKVMYRLKTVAIRSAKNTAPGKVTVTYDKTTSGDSYVLQYSDNEAMKNAKTIVVQGANTTTKVIGGLKKGKTYYISIRVRKKVNGIDYYTTFGVPKKVKIEK